MFESMRIQSSRQVKDGRFVLIMRRRVGDKCCHRESDCPDLQPLQISDEQIVGIKKELDAMLTNEGVSIDALLDECEKIAQKRLSVKTDKMRKALMWYRDTLVNGNFHLVIAERGRMAKLGLGDIIDDIEGSENK